MFIIDEINTNEQVKIVQAFNNNKFFKNLTSFLNILINITALIDQDYILTRSF